MFKQVTSFVLKVKMAGCVRLLFVLQTIGICLSAVLKVNLNNHVEMPKIALGTFIGFDELQKNKGPAHKDISEIIKNAIDVGYRHIDSAPIYNTEEDVGKGVRAKIEDGTVKREDIFITTKLWNTDHGKEQVTGALKESLKRMGLDYVDLYLIHWPVALNKDYSFSDVDYMDTWRGMEDVYNSGLAKSIGVSNFNKTQLERVLKEGTVKPSTLQIEVHPQFVQEELVDFAHKNNIVVMGYSPLGSIVSRFGVKITGSLSMDDPGLVEIAKKYGKTVPQVMLRWQVDRDIIPIPKTVTLKRLQENIDIFDFQLTAEEIKTINGYNTSHMRLTIPSFWQEHPNYPFEKVDNPIEDVFKNNT